MTNVFDNLDERVLKALEGLEVEPVRVIREGALRYPSGEDPINTLHSWIPDYEIEYSKPQVDKKRLEKQRIINTNQQTKESADIVVSNFVKSVLYNLEEDFKIFTDFKLDRANIFRLHDVKSYSLEGYFSFMKCLGKEVSLEIHYKFQYPKGWSKKNKFLDLENFLSASLITFRFTPKVREATFFSHSVKRDFSEEKADKTAKILGSFIEVLKAQGVVQEC